MGSPPLNSTIKIFINRKIFVLNFYYKDLLKKDCNISFKAPEKCNSFGTLCSANNTTPLQTPPPPGKNGLLCLTVIQGKSFGALNKFRGEDLREMNLG